MNLDLLDSTIELLNKEVTHGTWWSKGKILYLPSQDKRQVRVGLLAKICGVLKGLPDKGR